MSDHPDVRREAALEQEIHNYACTVEGLEAELRRIKRTLALVESGCAWWVNAAAEQKRRADRYRSRLARVLQLAQADRLWVGIPDGAVWSRRHPHTRRTHP